MCNEIPFIVEKISSPASVGNRVLDSFIINPALNPHSATGRIGRQRERERERERESDNQPARRTDNQIERDREGEMKTVLLTLQQLHC